ncbi:MAG: serine--tRNA ligase, partial [Candidatus Omnitrophica bacterium]|nr:serine--tRNA ligase [Candidatus Omnitrophota bacterium]
MLDIKFIREHPDTVKQAIKNRNLELDIDLLLELDRQWKALTMEAEELKRKRNIASDEMAVFVKNKQDISMQRGALKELSQKTKEIDEKVGELRQKINKIMINVPNIPHKSVPVGLNETANKEIKTWGTPKKLNFAPKTHIELSEQLDIIDLPRATKITGSNFVLYKGAGARLERALINFMLGMHTEKHGFIEISPPFIVNR